MTSSLLWVIKGSLTVQNHQMGSGTLVSSELKNSPVSQSPIQILVELHRRGHRISGRLTAVTGKSLKMNGPKGNILKIDGHLPSVSNGTFSEQNIGTHQPTMLLKISYFPALFEVQVYLLGY